MSDIKYALYTSSKGFKVVGGIAAQFLKADGSVDATSYIPAGTDINMADKNINFTTGSLSRFENDSRVFNKVFQKITYAAQTGIFSVKFLQATAAATMFDVTLKIYGYQNKLLGNLRISFYKITDTTINPNGAKAVIEISDNFPTTVINVGVDADGKVSINIGESTTFWNTYVAVEVERVSVHYTGRTADWSKGWSQVMETDTTNYQSLLNIVPDVVASRSWVDLNNTGSVPKSPSLLSTADLNTFVIPGFYYQHANGNATTANNYPSEGLFAGSLRVYKTMVTGIVQEYQTRTSGGSVTFIRSTENNGVSWTAWKRVLTSVDFNPSNYFTKTESLNQFVGKTGIETISDTKTFTHSPIIPNGTIGTHAVNKNQIELSATQEGEGGQQLNISGNNSVSLTNFYVTSQDGTRNADDIAPNSTSRRVRFDFVKSNSAKLKAAGNYAGIMTYSPWDGTTGSTGDSSYQLAFANQTGINGDGLPMLKIRKGIDGNWTTPWYKLWTEGDFTSSNIQQWNYAYQYGLKLNQEFTTNLNTGLLIADNYFGGESGIIDNQQKKFLAAKRGEYYFYGSELDLFDGLNYHVDMRTFGMGREANGTDKLTVEGSVKASKNFKSEDERADTVFIPNGNVSNLRDEIINDESEYAIRLDPHEYVMDSYSDLVVDDRNRLIHIIGEYTKMFVDFKNIYPKQQIVIYNFDQNDGLMEVKIQGKPIYYIESRCFIRLYVTRSLRVIVERLQPCEIVW